MTLDPAYLRLQIDEAFGAMPYPADEHIFDASSGYDPGKISALKGRHWRDVTFDTLDRLREALVFMSPEGFRFYLPAYMIISVMDSRRADVIPGIVVRALTPSQASDFDRTREQTNYFRALEPSSSIDWDQVAEQIAPIYQSDEGERVFFERVAGFSEAQCKVILQFLEHMRDAHGEEFLDRAPETAIERYWHRF